MRNSFGPKYVHVPTNNTSGRSSYSRTNFTSAAGTERRKVSDITSMNSKTNSFETRRGEFRTKVNLNKTQFIKVTSPLT
jgi:hypothetical protein